MKLDMIGIIVQNTARSLEFYRKLGWEIPEVAPDENHVEITLENGLRFAWDELSMMQSFDPEAKISEQYVGAFLCKSPSEVDAKYLEITSAGYVGHKAPWDAFWGQRYAIIKDPDGHKLDLFAPL
jgi:catechol 2,3-dioxygenase-like lactoylglutathione lyase family enzyme